MSETVAWPVALRRKYRGYYVRLQQTRSLIRKRKDEGPYLT